MDGPILRDGAVAFADGLITDIGKATDVTARHRGGDVLDLGDAVVLPGLVNAHTHLELSNCSSGSFPGGSFADWILSLPARSGRDRLSPEELYPPAVQLGIEQCLRFGVTTVGDISQQMHLSRPVIAKSPLRCVSYGEVLGTMGLRWRYDELLPRAIDPSLAGERLVIGLTPHAPYTVDLPGYQQCAALSKERGLPLATHLAETPDEREFLERHTGLFRELWEKIGLWRDDLETFRGSPVAFAKSVGLLDGPTVLAHVNYCDDSDLSLLAAGRGSVVYCPRTHAYFGHAPHRWREMLARGINVAVGTDSCASSPDLNIVDDLRLVRKQSPDVTAQTLWEMATIRGARALGLADRIGSLTAGKAANLISFAASSDGHPLEEILLGDTGVADVWIGGQRQPP
jgi:cytosine/adenosine deaminase-related metal-dependent hydrolase